MKRKVYQSLFFLFIIAFVFQQKLSEIIPVFNYLDETCALLLFILGLFNQIYCKKCMAKSDVISLICLTCSIFLGMIASFIYGYQNAYYTLLGGFMHVKFFFLMFGIKWLAEDFARFDAIIVLKNTCFASLLFILFADVINRIVYGFSFMAMLDTCSKMIFLIAGIYITSERLESKLILTVGGCVLLYLTGRAKAYAGILMIIALYVWMVNLNKKIKLFDMLLLGIGAIALAWNKIYFYYVWGAAHNYARAVLTMTGIKIANDYFPLGTGFGTYASYVAAEQYSPVYYIYGISEHYEMGVNTQMFLLDTYWPSVMGEMGWGGVIFLIAILFIIFMKVQVLYKNNRNIYYACMLSFLYMIITTFEETGFMQPLLMCNAIIIGICIGYSDTYEVKEMLELKDETGGIT